MAERREFYFPSSDGKTRIHAVEWLPEGEARGVVQLVHGIAEYVLRYDAFARQLTARGFASAKRTAGSMRWMTCTGCAA